MVQLSGEIDPDALARQYGMENRGPVASLPNSYRFKKTSSAPRNVISALGKQKGVTLNKRRFAPTRHDTINDTRHDTTRKVI